MRWELLTWICSGESLSSASLRSEWIEGVLRWTSSLSVPEASVRVSWASLRLATVSWSSRFSSVRLATRSCSPHSDLSSTRSFCKPEKQGITKLFSTKVLLYSYFYFAIVTSEVWITKIKYRYTEQHTEMVSRRTVSWVGGSARDSWRRAASTIRSRPILHPISSTPILSLEGVARVGLTGVEGAWWGNAGRAATQSNREDRWRTAGQSGTPAAQDSCASQTRPSDTRAFCVTYGRKPAL